MRAAVRAAAVTAAAAGLAVVLTVPPRATRVALDQQRRAVLVDVFPPTPAVSARVEERRGGESGEGGIRERTEGACMCAAPPVHAGIPGCR